MVTDQPETPAEKRAQSPVVLRVIAAAILIHCVLGAFLELFALFMLPGLSGSGDSVTGMSPSHRFLYFVTRPPPHFFNWCFLIANLAALYIVNRPSAAVRVRLLRAYLAFVAVVAIVHIGGTAVAAMVGTLHGNGIMVGISPEQVIDAAVFDAIFLIPAPLVLLAERIRSARLRGGCEKCGYDLAGLPAVEELRCPECGCTKSRRPSTR